jgi:hypothetical protein
VKEDAENGIHPIHNEYMKKILAYIFGGIACLGVGGIFYAALSAMPSGVTAPIPGGTGMPKQISAAIDMLGERLKDGNVPPAPEAPKETSVLFMGDMMLGRSVAQRISESGKEYPFAKIKDVVSAADYSVANLEGPMTRINNDSENRMRFHFDPALAPVLAEMGFDAFSLANNHGLDQGAKGAKETRENLAAAGLAHFGDVSSDHGEVLSFRSGGTDFAVIGLHDVYRRIDPKDVAVTIASLKEAGKYVIVYPHWGDEYQHEANARQKELAHAFMDAGADMVIGSHPHVIEGIEEYGGKLIFYSLGNLIFDQYFSADTQEGVAIRLKTGASGVRAVELLPYVIPKSQPAFAEGEKRVKMLQDIASWSDPELKEEILSGIISF